MAFVFYKPLNCGIEPAKEGSYHSKRNRKHNFKTLYRFTLEGKYIGTYYFNKSIAEETGLKYISVNLAMRPTWDKRRRTLSAMDSIWIIKEDYSEEELKRKVEQKKNDSNLNPKSHKRSKKIKQIDVETGEVIQIWDSINQAGKEEITGYKVTSICRVLNGSRQTYAGCFWQYN